MRHGSLFSGIGGFDLAAQWMGWENIFQVEKDEYCQRTLHKNFPKTSKYWDIKEFDAAKYRGTIDVLTGGFPCQPTSLAGKRKGEDDDRWLWPEMFRIVREVKPTVIVGKNVAGLISMDGGRLLSRIFADLEGEGYKVESFIIPAAATGAWHKRERIWIVAYRNSKRSQERERKNTEGTRQESGAKLIGIHRIVSKDVSDTKLSRWYKQFRWKIIRMGRKKQLDAREGRIYWSTEPRVGRMADGIPNRVDRIKGLGNAIVPQVAYEIFRAIEEL